MSLKDQIYNKFKNVITSWNQDVINEIYVISFFVYDIDDDPCYPTVTLGYNTKSNYEDSIPYAYDKGEAKWNYAFYLQNEESQFGYDDDEQDLISEWLEDNGVFFDKDTDDDMLLETITIPFIKVLIEVVLQLHKDNVIKNVFKQDIPIIVHELEYYHEIAEQNQIANPDGIADEFVNWVMSEYENFDDADDFDVEFDSDFFDEL